MKSDITNMSWKIREALWLALAAPAREVVFRDAADHVVAPARPECGQLVGKQRLPPVANAVSDHRSKEFAMFALARVLLKKEITAHNMQRSTHYEMLRNVLPLTTSRCSPELVLSLEAPEVSSARHQSKITRTRRDVASLAAKPFDHAAPAEHVLLVVLGRIPHYLLKIIHSFDSTFSRRNPLTNVHRRNQETGILTLGQACMM